jgi:adenosylhomocysteinase
MEAVMDGFKVMKMSEAAPIGDFFVTVTGCCEVITKEHFLLMKDGAILSNADTLMLRSIWRRSKQLRSIPMSQETYYRLQAGDGNTVFVIAEGRLVNICAGDGHPAEIMDMSFAIQALSALYLVKNKGKFTEKIINVPREVDLEVARRKLKFWGFEIDKLTEKQEKYLDDWK